MATTECLEACKAAGFRVNAAAQTASGVIRGAAFRITPATETVELSVNLPEKKLAKLVPTWQAQCAGLTAVEGESCSVVLTCPQLSTWDAERLTAFLEAIVSSAVSGAVKASEGKHEKDRESVAAYIRGFIGACGGALCGALPWFLARQLLGWNIGVLLGLVGVASFFGYRWLQGAHSTRYALVLVVTFSLVGIVLFELADTTFLVWEYRDVYAEIYGAWWMLDPDVRVWDILWFCVTDRTLLVELVRELLWPLGICALGLVGIRRQIQIYTHESAFLQRNRRK